MARKRSGETAQGLHRALTAPGLFLIRMLIFLTLVGFLGAILHEQLTRSIMTNPGLNGLILGVLAFGIVYSFRQVMRLYPEIRWVNAFRIADPGLAIAHKPRLLLPMATMLRDRTGSISLSTASMSSIMESLGSRLDEARDTGRYMVGLLVFLGLLGTFWGLLDTIQSVGQAIGTIDTKGGDTVTVFDDLKSGLAAPLKGMGTAFSSSLLGLAGSLILGFLDLQASQAQNSFYTELEDWMSSMTELDHPVTQMQATGLGVSGGEVQAMLERLGTSMQSTHSSQNAIRAMAELAKGIDGLVKHIRAEQDDLRKHIIEQGETNRRLRDLIDAMLAEDEHDRRQ